MTSPDELAGRNDKCPSCGWQTMVPRRPLRTVPRPPPPVRQPPPPLPRAAPQGAAAAPPAARRAPDTPPPVPLKIMGRTDTSPEVAKHLARLDAREARSKSRKRDPFGPEKYGMSKGVVGGVIMMGIAVVWFIVGWIAGWIFFYPPILFVLGLLTFFKGMATGNISGPRDDDRWRD